jgi:hypothetical protein
MSKNPGLWIVILGVVILWNIYDMTSATEAPSQGITILHWVLLICGVAGIGAIMQYMQQKKRSGS